MFDVSFLIGLHEIVAMPMQTVRQTRKSRLRVTLLEE